VKVSGEESLSKERVVRLIYEKGASPLYPPSSPMERVKGTERGGLREKSSAQVEWRPYDLA